MTPMQYGVDLYAKLCSVADVYAESTLSDSFIKTVNFFIRHSLRKYWTSH